MYISLYFIPKQLRIKGKYPKRIKTLQSKPYLMIKYIYILKTIPCKFSIRTIRHTVYGTRLCVTYERPYQTLFLILLSNPWRKKFSKYNEILD